MIHFVLQKFGDWLIQSRPFVCPAIFVVKADRNGLMSLQTNQQRRETHAVIPHRECLRAVPHDFGVDEQLRSLSHIHRDESLRYPDLRGGYRPPKAVARAECSQGGVQRSLIGLECRAGKIRDRGRDLPKARISKLEDWCAIHGCTSEAAVYAYL